MAVSEENEKNNFELNVESDVILDDGVDLQDAYNKLCITATHSKKNTNVAQSKLNEMKMENVDLVEKLSEKTTLIFVLKMENVFLFEKIKDLETHLLLTRVKLDRIIT